MTASHGEGPRVVQAATFEFTPENLEKAQWHIAKYPPGRQQSAVLPLLFLLTMATALAAGLWLAALNARYRDIQYVSAFLVQSWFFLTPVVYSAGILPARFTFIYGLNPMVGVVQGFRSALIGSATHGHTAHVAALHVGPLLILSVGIVLAMLAGGLAYFRRTETIFADVV